MNSNPYTHDNVRKGAFHYLFGRGAAGLAGFLTVLLLVRFMDVQNYAAYTAMSGLVIMCGILAALGMDRVIARYVPEGRLHYSVNHLARFIWITTAIRLTVASAIASLLYFFWPSVKDFLTVADFSVFPLGLFCLVVAEVLFQHCSSMLQSLMLQKSLTRLLVVQWGGRLVLICGLVVAKGSITWNESLWVMAVPEMVGAVGFVWLIRRHLRQLADDDSHQRYQDTFWPDWGGVSKVALHNYGFTLLAAPPQGYFMKILAAAYLPVDYVAAYGFFLSIAEKARQYIPLHFFFSLIEPIMIAGYLKDRDYSALTYRCQLLYKSNLLLMVPAIAWVMVAGDAIVGIMTAGKFQGLSWILLVVLLQLTVGSHVVLLQLILNSLQKSSLLIRASSMALVAMALSIVLSVGFKTTNLLYTPIVFSLAMNAWIIFELNRSGYSYNPPSSMMWSVIVSGLVSILLTGLIMKAAPWQPYPLAMAIVALAIVMVIYAASIWMTKAIKKSEIDLVLGLLRKRTRQERTSQESATLSVSNSTTNEDVLLPPSDLYQGRQLIGHLQEHARKTLDSLIPAGASVALLDYPNNPNVGDSLIWLGEIAYLKSRNVAIDYVCDVLNYNRTQLSNSLGEQSILLLHGGGNFGTLWREEHQFRLQVLRDFPGMPIVQFPQSIHFDDLHEMAETAHAIKQHGNYTLLVRDQQSFDFAADHFECKTFLCPDMAFFIGPLEASTVAPFDRFILSRTDHEKSSNWLEELPALQRGHSVDVNDWLKAGQQERVFCRIEKHSRIFRRYIDPRNKGLLIFWNQLAKWRLNRGRKLLERGRVIISDRLHVHILSILLNKPHVLIDNSSHKISSLHQAWTQSYRGVRFANKNLREALLAAQMMESTMGLNG